MRHIKSHVKPPCLGSVAETLVRQEVENRPQDLA